MSSGSIGFSLQGDVVSGGSLLFNASGRLLKAMSDGGVDIYAVAATVWLGKTIPIDIHHESLIQKLLASRGSRTGFLVKALSIGWGHSDIAIELARTRAGTAGLLVIGALATGSSYYVAAAGISELLLLSGCEADRLPNVDSLKTLIAYVAPIMVDTGFIKVFEHIVTTVKLQCERHSHEVPSYLLDNGEARVWAGAVRQLILIAEKGEEFHFIVRQRGAWLAAYASHNLGMAVKIVYMHEVHWETAGANGSVTFELHGSDTPALWPARKMPFQIVMSPSTIPGNRPMQIDYAISDALENELSLQASANAEDIHNVHYMIARICWQLICRPIMSSRHGEGIKINFGFDNASAALRKSLADLGISPDVIESCYMVKAAPTTGISLAAFSGPIKALIFGMAATILALVQCVYSTDDALRVDSDIVSGRRTTRWSSAIANACNYAFDSHVRLYPVKRASSRMNNIVGTSKTDVLLHISSLLQGSEASTLDIKHPPSTETTILAISASKTTILYRTLMDEQCFDDEGRMFRIESGRISLNGVLRGIVFEGHYNEYLASSFEESLRGVIVPMAVGFQLQSHYAPNSLKVLMTAELLEHEIGLKTQIVDADSDTNTNIALSSCLDMLSSWRVPRTCPHDIGNSLRVNRENEMYVARFGHKPRSNWPGIFFYALKGRQIEQIIQCGILGPGGQKNGVFQFHCCIECSVKAIPEQSFRIAHIIMAG